MAGALNGHLLSERASTAIFLGLAAVGVNGSEASDEEELREGGEGEGEGGSSDGLGRDGEGRRWGPDVHGFAEDPDGGGGRNEGGAGEEEIGSGEGRERVRGD